MARDLNFSMIFVVPDHESVSLAFKKKISSISTPFFNTRET